jgi:hypothetical protein
MVRRVGFRTTSIVAVILHLIAGGFAAALRSAVDGQPGTLIRVKLDGGSAGSAGNINTNDTVASRPSTSNSSVGGIDDVDNKAMVWPAFTAPAALLFLGTVMVCSAYFAAIQSYLFLWLSDLSAGPDIMGLSLTFTCITEPIFFFFAPAWCSFVHHARTMDSATKP